MSFLRASIIRGTPGFNFDYSYFATLAESMDEFFSLNWFDIKQASREKRDLIATYNMGQEL